MNKKTLLLTLLFIFLLGSTGYAHSGRTDSSGGHNCSAKSQSKGLCSGYHYHNGGSSSSNSTSGNTSQSYDKDCSDFTNYDEVIAYWNAKGYSATNDPENLDGWGNGVVDDGIPCEAPSSYDLTKVNNSNQQKAYKMEQQDITSGENAGYKLGLEDGYQETPSKANSATGSVAYKNAFISSYNQAYSEGQQKIKDEKTKAINEGYSLGISQSPLVIPPLYTSHAGLSKAFEDGFNKAVDELIETKKSEYNELGYNDGIEDVYNAPKEVEKIYLEAYQFGYDKAQSELKEKYMKLGYEAAFKFLTYQDPGYTNPKFVEWYRQEFETNKEVIKIQKEALKLGQSGNELVIPKEYEKAKVIYNHYYELGFAEYKQEQSTKQKAAAGGVGLVFASWLGRRFYVARKMIV